MPSSETIHAALRYSHIFVGFIGLVVFWIPVFARKGSRLHIRCGRVFVWCGYFIVASALASCGWALADPLGFTHARHLEGERAVMLARTVRFFFSILAYLAIVVLASLRMGMRVVQTRKEPEALGSTSLRFIYIALAAVSLALLAHGLLEMRVDGWGSRYMVSVILGLLGLNEVRGGFRFMRNPRPTRMAWWYKHMECMLGAGVGFHTAFAVFGFRRLLGLELEGLLALVPWVLPALIGAPVMIVWIRYYKRKFGELEPSVPVATASPVVSPTETGTG